MAKKNKSQSSRTKDTKQLESPKSSLVLLPVALIEECAALVELPGRGNPSLQLAFKSSSYGKVCTAKEYVKMRRIYYAAVAGMLCGGWVQMTVLREHVERVWCHLVHDNAVSHWLPAYGLSPPPNTSSLRGFYGYWHLVHKAYGPRPFIDWVCRAVYHGACTAMSALGVTGFDPNLSALTAITMKTDAVIDELVDFIGEGVKPPPSPLSAQEIAKRKRDRHELYAKYCVEYPPV